LRRKEIVLIVLLLVLVLIGVGADIVITFKAKPPTPVRSSLPCAAIPTRYVMEYPECADKLLQAMNVTNVRIRPVETSSLNRKLDPNETENPGETADPKLYVSLWRNGSITLEQAVDHITQYMENTNQKG